MGIEPTPSAWEAEVLPLNYALKMLGLIFIHLPGTGTHAQSFHSPLDRLDVEHRPPRPRLR